MSVTGDHPPARIPWLQIGIETFFVITGVLLALAVDEWRQGRRDQQLVDLSIRNIREEIDSNRKEVRRALQHHQELLALGEERPKGVDFGTKPAIIRNNAWEAAQASQAAAKMDFTLVAAISKMEEAQDTYQKLVGSALPLVYQNLSEGARMSILYDLSYFENMLLQVYDETERVIAGV
ncbi:MAG TPA: hypothetical protein VN493_30825 [Thermoanaerobaculia bacterium]|nr:hypothetical protein [Thermoanaerobaculia bacterium]